MHIGYDPTLPSSLLLARWSAAGAIARTELRLVAERRDCTVSIWSWGSGHIALMDADTAFVIATSVQCDQPPAQTYSARLVVTVYDESYTRYTEHEWFTDVDQKRATNVGLTGAFGVFGAAASSAVPVVLSRQ